METHTPADQISPPPTGKPGLPINRNFGLLVIGQGISQFGDFIFSFTLMVWIVTRVAAGQPWAPLTISAIMISFYLPYLVVGPWAGVFVDRWQHRQTMIVMDLIRACLIALMVLFTGAVPLPWQFPPLFIISVVCLNSLLDSICGQFFNPSTVGLIGQIVPQEQQAQAQGLSQAINASAKLIGPLLGPILYFSVGILACLLIDVISFLISVATVWAIHAPHLDRAEAGKQRFWSEFAQGVNISFQDRVLRALAIISFVVSLGIGAFDSLFIFFVQRNLHTSASLSGAIISAVGLGTIGGALFFGRFAKNIGLERLFYSTLTCVGIGLIVFSRLTSFPLAVLVTLLIGVLLAGINVAIVPLLLRETPEHMVGRVDAVLNTFGMGGNLLSAVLAGYLAGVALVSLHIQAFGTTFGPIDTVFLGSGCLFTLGGLYAWTALRKRSQKIPASPVELLPAEKIP